ncbi:hypothetical protein X756_31145 [Mesorhizobium sp. LSHC412B00]|nr:hypothetical protein X756_31145 [Mesorhizobium sp. LSHC412B00]
MNYTLAEAIEWVGPEWLCLTLHMRWNRKSARQISLPTNTSV